MPSAKPNDAAKLRRARGKTTQEAAAKIIGVSTRHYQRLEAGGREIRAGYISALEHAHKKA